MVAVAVVAFFAVIQSLFGIGLLAFGTPTLLLLGYSFSETLTILLPASLVVSVLQARTSPLRVRYFASEFALWCLLPLVLTLGTVLTLGLHASLNVAVALLLLLFAIVRTFPRVGVAATAWVAHHQRAWFVCMGAVHGLSNLGGGPLVILAASRYERKEDVRGFVAFCYACFAAVQLIVLAALTPSIFGLRQLLYALVAAIVFVVIGQRVFRWVSAPVFRWLLTAFATAYAGLLGLRAVGVI